MGDHRAVVGKHAETVLSEIRLETTLQTQLAAQQVLKVKETEINEMGGTPDAVPIREKSGVDDELMNEEEKCLIGKATKLTPLSEETQKKANNARSPTSSPLAEEVNQVIEMLRGS